MGVVLGCGGGGFNCNGRYVMAVDKENWQEDLREWKLQSLKPVMQDLGLVVGDDELDLVMEVVMDICREQRVI